MYSEKECSAISSYWLDLAERERERVLCNIESQAGDKRVKVGSVLRCGERVLCSIKLLVRPLVQRKRERECSATSRDRQKRVKGVSVQRRK